MRGFALNFLLALVWALFAGEVSTREIVVGFLLGFAILAVFPRALGTQGYVRRVLVGLGFLGFFLRELIVANVQMALFALRPRPPLHPMIVAVPVRVQGDTAQTLLVATLTLMPGTVVMGLSADRRTLYAHAIGMPSAEAARAAIARVEDRLLPLFPPTPLSPGVRE